MSGSIICGVDDSKSAKSAARVARGLSAELGLPLIFVHCVEPTAQNDSHRATVERLQRLTAFGNHPDCGAEWLVDVGPLADRLVAVAGKRHAAFIVLGATHPCSSPAENVSAEVLEQAQCPLVIVPPGGTAAATNGHHVGHAGTEFEDGIARFRFGSLSEDGRTNFAGGIARFSLGSRGSGA